jgi:hypothetical protein
MERIVGVAEGFEIDWLPTDPQVRNHLLSISEDSWIRASEQYWSISPQEPPSGSIRADVRRRRQWLKRPNRQNVGKAVQIPLDFLTAALDHLIENEVLSPDGGMPIDHDQWVEFLDTIEENLGSDYASICMGAAPYGIPWTPKAHEKPDLENGESPNGATDSSHSEETNPSPTAVLTVGDDNPTPTAPATSEQLRALLEELRERHRVLSGALQSAISALVGGNPVSIDLAGHTSQWNRILTDLAVGLHGEERFGLDLDELEKTLNEMQAQEEATDSYNKELAEKTALLSQYETQRQSPLYAGDTDFRAFLDAKISKFERDLGRPGEMARDPGPESPDIPDAEPEDEQPHLGDAVSPQSSTHPEPSDAKTPTSPERGDHTPPAPETTNDEPDSGPPQPPPAATKREKAPPTPDRPEGPAEAHIERRPELETDPSEDDRTPETESSDAVGRGLARLITRDEWAASCAVIAVTDANEDIANAINFCAEAFSLPIISTDPREMLGNNVGKITQGLQAGGTAAALTVIGLLRACLSVGREQSWLLTEDSFDALPGPWRDTARNLRDAVNAGYRHFRGHASALGNAIPPDALRRKAEELKETIPKRTFNFAPAANVLRQLMSSDGDLFLALDAVCQWVDGNGDLQSLRGRRAVLDDPRKLVDRVDADAAGRNKPRRSQIDRNAFDSLSARIAEVTDVVDHAIVLAEAEENGSEVGRETGARTEKIRMLIDGLPEVPFDGTIVSAALDRFRAWLQDGSGPVSDTGRSFTQLKFFATLPAVSAVRDRQSNLPSKGDVPAQTLINEILEPKPYSELFQDYLQCGNLAAAHIVETDDHEALLLRSSEREWKARIDKLAVDLSSELLRLQAHTQVDPVDRARIDGEISALKTPPEDRFDLMQSRVEEIRSEFVDRWHTARQEMLAGLRERAAALNVDQTEVNRVEKLIDQNDLITAREFLSHLGNPNADSPQSQEDDGLVTLRDFYEFLENWPAEERRPLSVVERATGSAPPEQVGAALRAWSQGLQAKKPHDWQKPVESMLTLLGLEKLPDQPVIDRTERNETKFGKFSVKANPVGGSCIAALGSKARLKGYTIYTLMPGTPVDSVLEKIPTSDRREANLIFFPGVLGWQDRRAIRTAADEQKVTALVIDSAAVAYQAVQGDRKFKTLQRITLPFSIFKHWAPRVAGDVPDELFVGRTDLIDKIISPEGSIFVYGGRQLGKSALLHRIERDFNRLEKKLAIYIDFKVERIGEENEPEHLWTVLRNRLQDAGVIAANRTSTSAEAIEKGIRDWLEADHDRRILLLCDESDAFLQDEARERLVNNRVGSFPNVAVLKGLMDKTERRFKPVFAGLHQVQRIADIPNSPLAHGGESILVGPLSPTEAWDLVVRPFRALGYQFESVDLVWRLLAFTNYHAGLVQIVCDELCTKMRDAQTRIPPGQPPYIITAAEVDSIITSKDVLDFIAERFRLTIQLEDRYFVIAMIVALLSLDSGFHNSYSRSDILGFCRDAWPAGFNFLTENDLSVYLDEMVGLNVLIPGTDPGRYGLRSPNVVHILGDRETIEKQLTDGRFELPLQYNARVSRRRLREPREGESYSPLTEYELSQIMPKRNAARDRFGIAVIGSPALGISSLVQVLNEASKEDYEYGLTVVSADESAELVKAASGARVRRPLVVCDAIERPDRVDEVAAKLIASTKADVGRRAALLGPSGASVCAQLKASGVDVIPLQLWTVETLRATIDNPITDPQQRDDLIVATGGWPHLCEAYLSSVRANAVVSEVIDRARRFPESPDDARKFLSDVGLTDGRDLALLGPWASLVQDHDVIDEATLHDLIEFGADDWSAMLDRLIVLSVVSERGRGFVLNNVIRRSLITIGAADAD